MLIATIIATLIACELIYQLPFASVLRQILSNMRKSVRVVKSPLISDYWKEKVLLIYSRRIGLATITITLMMFLVFIPFFFVGLVTEGGFEALTTLILSIEFMLIATVLAVAYMFFRKRLG